MKAKLNSADTVQTLVCAINSAHTKGYQVDETRAQLKDTLQGLGDEAQAISLIKDVLSQAILQGLAEVVIIKGKRNDKTSNWKRDLAKAYNTAYESNDTRLVLTTKGKGQARLVNFEIKAKPVALTGKKAFVAKLEKVVAEANPTQAELASIITSAGNLYDAEQERVAKSQAKQQTLADNAKANQLATVTANVSAQLEAQGIKATKGNIEVALAMVGNA